MSAKPVNDMLALLCSTFRCEIDSYQKRAYVRTLGDVPGDVLLAAADLLINESAAGRKFYPMPTAPDVKGACAKVLKQRQQAARDLHLSDCPHSSQWVEDEKTGRLKRCPCYERMQAAIASIGTLALPAAPSEPETPSFEPIGGDR